MKKFCILAGLLFLVAGAARAAEEYPLTADSERQPGVPQGTVTKYTWNSNIFPGTVRDYWVYVPAQYTADKPACVMLFEDGSSYVKESGRARIPIVFDNLIARHDMPVTIAILVDPGVLHGAAPGQHSQLNRSFEYDSLSDRYARFLLEEIIPEVSKHYNLSTNPDDRAISGGSSGGICSFNVAWTHPEAFHRVLSFIGSFADLRGGDIFPALIRKTEPKPIRVFLQDGDHDLNNYAASWWLSNQAMAMALEYSGYDYKFVAGDKDHDMIQGGAILPDALRWLWRDYPKPIAKPAMDHLGDRQTGYVDVGPGWEHVATIPFNPEKRPLPSFLLLNHRLRDASGIAVGPQGEVFVTDPAGENIYKVDSSGQISNYFHDAAGARSLAFSSNGQLYGCGGDGIYTYSPQGTKSLRMGGVNCQDLAVANDGTLIFSSVSGIVVLGPHNRDQHGPTSDWGYRSFNANGISLSFDQGMLYVGDPNGKWVWSYQLQPNGTLANGEPFFRLETTDESSASGATGMASDSKGFLYVASLLGVQMCDVQGKVVGILNRPEQADPSLGPISGLAFGGPGREYLYVLVGNEIFRRHFTPKPATP